MGIKAPTIGQWFLDPNLLLKFEVIAIDDLDGAIEVLYTDGELAEIDIATWQRMNAESCSPAMDSDENFEENSSNFDGLSIYGDETFDDLSPYDGGTSFGLDDYL